MMTHTDTEVYRYGVSVLQVRESIKDIIRIESSDTNIDRDWWEIDCSEGYIRFTVYLHIDRAHPMHRHINTSDAAIAYGYITLRPF